MITDNQWDWLAQKAHLLGGSCAVFLGHEFWAMKGALIGAGLITGWAAFKEFYWDDRNESAEERGSNLRDFMYYVCGAGLALILIVLATKFQF